MLDLGLCMENIDKDIVVFNESCAHHSIWEVVVGSCWTIDVKEFVDAEIVEYLEAVEDN